MALGNNMNRGRKKRDQLIPDGQNPSNSDDAQNSEVEYDEDGIAKRLMWLSARLGAPS